MFYVKDLMSSPVISVNSQETVETAAKLMIEKKVSSLIVTQDGANIGIVTQTDFVRRILALGHDSKTTSVGYVMSTPLLVIDQNIDPKEAKEFMLKHNIKHVLVTAEKKVQGVLTAKDMMS